MIILNNDKPFEPKVKKNQLKKQLLSYEFSNCVCGTNYIT